MGKFLGSNGHLVSNDSRGVTPEQSLYRGVSKTPPPMSAVPAIFTINQLKRKFDSVDNIMDKIDAGISTLKKIEVRSQKSMV